MAYFSTVAATDVVMVSSPLSGDFDSLSDGDDDDVPFCSSVG